MRYRSLLAICSFLALGCPRRSQPAPILVSRITVSEATLIDNDSLGVDGDGLKQRLVEALDSTGRFRPLTPAEDAQKNAPASYRARVEIQFTRESDEIIGDAGPTMRRGEVGLTLTLVPAASDIDAAQLRAEVSASRLFDPGPGQPDTPTLELTKARTAAFQSALNACLAQAAADLVLQVDAASKPDKVLISDLSSGDAGVRDAAVRQLSERKNPAAVPALIERLKDPDRDVELRAMGALEGIRDVRAVRPLIDLTERQDPAFVAQVVYVIGAIGGSDAEAFLFTLKNGASEPQVRHAAAEAQAELHRRAEAANSGRAGMVPDAPRGEKR